MLKALVIRNKLDAAKRSLEDHLKGDHFAEREAELEAAVVELTVDSTEEERNAVTDAVNAFNEERDAFDNKRAELEKIISDTEDELREAEEEAPQEEEKDPEEINEKEERKTMYSVDSIEYRNAWVKKLINRELNDEERSALSAAANVIPKMTVNAVWDKLVKPAELLGKVDVSQFPNYVRFPVATTNNAATAQAVGGTISESSDVIGYVDLIPNEYVKLLTVGADIEHMAVEAVHDWIVDNLVGQIRYAINKDILVGSGTNALKGIKESVNANATAIPATVTKASILKIMAALPGNYQEGAIWVMSPKMFYEDIMGVTQLNDYVINDGFQFKLFGHDVILMSEAVISSKETIFYGDPKAYKVNIFKPIEVKPFETATTTNFQFRGACLADGELLDTSAFVRFAQS